jgi:multidrug efflux system membrane fusion protein
MRFMRFGKLLALGAALAAAALLIGALARPSPADTKATSRPAAPVKIATARAGSLPLQRQTIGSVVPLQSTALTSQTAGIVSEINMKDGATVKAGDLLVRLDDRSIQAATTRDKAAVARDQAALDNANATAKRVNDLVRTGVDTKQAGDDALAAVREAEATLAVDQAALAGDEVALSLLQIRAPFDGQLSSVALSLGAFVAPGTNIVTITQMKPVYAEFTLSEADLDLARTASAKGVLTAGVTALSPSGATAQVTGPIVFIDNAVDPASATFRLRALLQNDTGTLLPGQALTVDVTAGEKTGLVIVPSVAVQPLDDSSICYVVGADDKIEIRKVNVALRVGAFTGVDKGLAAGEKVVVEGQISLTTGTLVKTEAAPEGAEAALP